MGKSLLVLLSSSSLLVVSFFVWYWEASAQVIAVGMRKWNVQLYEIQLLFFGQYVFDVGF